MTPTHMEQSDPHPHGEMNRLACSDLLSSHNIVTNG